MPASVTRSACPRTSNQSLCRDLIIADVADMPYRVVCIRTEAGNPLHVVVLTRCRDRLFAPGGGTLRKRSRLGAGPSKIGIELPFGFLRAIKLLQRPASLQGLPRGRMGFESEWLIRQADRWWSRRRRSSRRSSLAPAPPGWPSRGP